MNHLSKISLLEEIAKARADNRSPWNDIENIVWQNYSPRMTVDPRDKRMSMLKHAFEIDPVKVERLLNVVYENDRRNLKILGKFLGKTINE